MLDYWPDGKIDCKDYAIYNSIQAEEHGHKPEWFVTKDHVVVLVELGGYDIILDGKRAYKLPRGLLKGLSVLSAGARAGSHSGDCQGCAGAE